MRFLVGRSCHSGGGECCTFEHCPGSQGYNMLEPKVPRDQLSHLQGTEGQSSGLEFWNHWQQARCLVKLMA